jgi:hypothetical protein
VWIWKSSQEVASNVLDLMKAAQKRMAVSLVYLRRDGAPEYQTKGLQGTLKTREKLMKSRKGTVRSKMGSWSD